MPEEGLEPPTRGLGSPSRLAPRRRLRRFEAIRLDTFVSPHWRRSGKQSPLGRTPKRRAGAGSARPGCGTVPGRVRAGSAPAGTGSRWKRRTGRIGGEPVGMAEERDAPHITAADLRTALAPSGQARRRPTALLSAEQPAAGWDWDTELSAADRAELDDLRRTVDEQCGELDSLRRQLQAARTEAADARDGLAELAAARSWRRRGVITRLRERHLLPAD
jgi:hypothetical protein